MKILEKKLLKLWQNFWIGKSRIQREKQKFVELIQELQEEGMFEYTVQEEDKESNITAKF